MSDYNDDKLDKGNSVSMEMDETNQQDFDDTNSNINNYK